ncbi:hypothetical protein KFU94_68185 [Chloroflexi bacterium TSY]|nr:hypothetical protein [Chloroflexi bacterium TSY]
MRYCFGDVEKVYAELRSLKTGVALPFTEALEDTAIVTFTFKNGVVGTRSWGLAAPGEEAYNVTFCGSEGSLRDTTGERFSIFHLFERRLDQIETARLTRADGVEYSMPQLHQMHQENLTPDEQELLYPGGMTDGFSIEIWEFLEILRGNLEKPEIDGWEGLRLMAICDAIYESALTGEVIQVDDVASGNRSLFQDPIDAHWNLT